MYSLVETFYNGWVVVAVDGRYVEFPSHADAKEAWQALTEDNRRRHAGRVGG